MRERLARQPEARAPSETSPARVELREHARVVGRIDDDRDALVVLGRRADHRRPADVDVLDRLVERRAARDRLAERVEVHDHEIDRDEAGLPASPRGASAVGRPEEAAVDARVQRLDAPVEDLGRAGVVADLAHRHAGRRQRPRRAAGRQDLETRGATGRARSSTTPVLSETEISAREIFATLCFATGRFLSHASAPGALSADCVRRTAPCAHAGLRRGRRGGAGRRSRPWSGRASRPSCRPSNDSPPRRTREILSSEWRIRSPAALSARGRASATTISIQVFLLGRGQPVDRRPA